MKKFGLSPKERIKNDKDFELLYKTGETETSDSFKIKASFFIHKDSPEPGVKAAFGVSKKAGNAAWRNRVKRLLRESFRSNKEILTAVTKEKNILLLIVFSPNNINQKNSKKIFLKDISEDVTGLMNKIRDRL